MSENFRLRLRRGDRLIGTIVAIESPEVVEVLAGAGFDWLFIDAEHSPLSPQGVQRMVMAAGELPCVVRVPANNEAWIKHVLDAGAAGIIVPLVNTAADAALAVQRAKYPPQGVRGVGPSRALGYGYGIADYVARANADTAVIVQAEHTHAVPRRREHGGLDEEYGRVIQEAAHGQGRSRATPELVCVLGHCCFSATSVGTGAAFSCPLSNFHFSPTAISISLSRI